MDHRTSINEVHQFLENQRKERLESAVSLMDASDSQLKAILYEARLAQHSLVRGSIAEIENTRKIESATLVLESRLDELSKSTLGSYIKKAGDSAETLKKSFHDKLNKADDADIAIRGMGENRPDRNEFKKALGVDSKTINKLQDDRAKRLKGVGSAVKRLVKEALDELDEGIPGKRPKRANRFHITNRDGRPATLGSYPDRASAEKDRDAKFPGANVEERTPQGRLVESED
jgi:hypothetical protein